MLHQMTARASVEALLHGEAGIMKELAVILDEPNNSMDNTDKLLQPMEVAEFLAKASPLTMDEYTALLNYLRQAGHPYRAVHEIPYPQNAVILPPNAERVQQMHHGGRTFSSRRSHKGNSAIQFYNPFTQIKATGFIEMIWRIPLEASIQTFIVVRPHQLLPIVEEEQAPFIQRPGFLTRIVDAVPSDSLCIIEPRHIITHLVTFERPLGTYNINRRTLLICWALNRGRQ